MASTEAFLDHVQFFGRKLDRFVHSVSSGRCFNKLPYDFDTSSVPDLYDDLMTHFVPPIGKDRPTDYRRPALLS